MSHFNVTARNRVKRLPERASYDRALIYSILDEALICHVGFVVDQQPFVIPTIHARRDDTLLLHGATTSRMTKHIQAGNPICIATTLLDGLVVARAVFHNSMNYRSVVLFGTGRLLTDAEEKYEALRVLTERIYPGRWDDARLPNAKERKATSVVAVTIDSATAKMRTGGPKDDAEDYASDWWAGVIPIETKFHAPQNDEKLRAGIPAPGYLKKYKRGNHNGR
jgi:nitroimidazol reductase NimA-like FMN-containing flavoprotein (pyridoxamine 5'-phosphate oxidase superfamily)